MPTEQYFSHIRAKTSYIINELMMMMSVLY